MTSVPDTLPSQPSYELELLSLKGTPRAMGQAHGEHFRDKILSFVAMRFDAVDGYFRQRGHHSSEQPDANSAAPFQTEQTPLNSLVDVGRPSLELYAQWDPTGYEEHCGIAQGARVDPLELFTATNMTDMRDAVLLAASSGPPLALTPLTGCTSALIPASLTASGAALAGQTWDLNPPDLDYIAAFERKPASGPPSWTVTCTGCLSLMGINERGLCVGTTNIKTYGSRPGVGYLSILHRALRAKNADEAAKLVQQAPHAGAHTYWIADTQTQLEWEASPNGSFRRDTSAGAIARSNHCLAESHQRIEGEVPGESSHKRIERMQTLLGKGEVTVDKLKTFFSDRGDGVHSINRYPEDEQGTATNAVFIAEPAERRAWACRGPADRGQWVELSF